MYEIAGEEFEPITLQKLSGASISYAIPHKGGIDSKERRKNRIILKIKKYIYLEEDIGMPYIIIASSIPSIRLLFSTLPLVSSITCPLL